MIGVDIDFRRLSVYALAELRERFDLVLFLGVLYHLRHPLLALDLIHAHVARDLLVVQCLLRGAERVVPVAENYPCWERGAFEEPGFPAAYFVERSYAGDPTNWRIPNRAGAQAMLRSAGFELLAHPEEEVFVCRRLAGVAEGAGARAAPPLGWAREPPP